MIEPKLEVPAELRDLAGDVQAGTVAHRAEYEGRV